MCCPIMGNVAHGAKVEADKRVGEPGNTSLVEVATDKYLMELKTHEVVKASWA